MGVFSNQTVESLLLSADRRFLDVSTTRGMVTLITSALFLRAMLNAQTHQIACRRRVFYTAFSDFFDRGEEKVWNIKFTIAI